MQREKEQTGKTEQNRVCFDIIWSLLFVRVRFHWSVLFYSSLSMAVAGIVAGLWSTLTRTHREINIRRKHQRGKAIFNTHEDMLAVCMCGEWRYYIHSHWNCPHCVVIILTDKTISHKSLTDFSLIFFCLETKQEKPMANCKWHALKTVKQLECCVKNRKYNQT